MDNFFHSLGRIKVPIASICFWVYALYSFGNDLISGDALSILFDGFLICGSLIVIGFFSLLNKNELLFYCSAGYALLKLIRILFIGHIFNIVFILSPLFSLFGALALSFVLGTQAFKPFAPIKEVGKRLFFLPAALELLSVFIWLILSFVYDYFYGG